MYKLLITGSNGQLGRAITKLYENNKDVELIRTDVFGDDIVSLNITSLEEVMTFVEKEKPYAIINCAAYTAVDASETDWDNAYRINAVGPRNLSIAATKVGAKLVHISTDYVFSGDADKPYTEFDMPNPQGAYGKTKLEGENFVKQFADKFFIIRTAWLYGDGKNFVKTMLRLSEANDKVRVVSDQYGSPTSTLELAKIIDRLLWTENYGLFHGTCEGSCSWADFAKEIFRLAGKETEVEYITTAEYPTPAKRPAYSVLDKYMLRLTCNYVPADWKDAIAEYMNSGLV